MLVNKYLHLKPRKDLVFREIQVFICSSGRGVAQLFTGMLRTYYKRILCMKSAILTQDYSPELNTIFI